MQTLFCTCATRVFIHNFTVSCRCKCEIYFSHVLCDYLYINLLCFLEMKMWTLYFTCAMRLLIHNLTVLFGDEMSLIFPGLIKILSFYRRKGNRKNYFTHNFSRWIVPYFLDHINAWNFIRGRVMIFHSMIFIILYCYWRLACY